MTFYDITKKMLFVNFRRYRLYFLCNVFSVALFYSFAAIFTNDSFMNPKIVDSSISSNIYAPSFLVGIFVVLFIPYSYNAFQRNRKHEYGIFITLGMGEFQAAANMLLENCIIAVISLISGLLLGTVISYVFYGIIQYVIGVPGLSWYLNIAAYQYTAALYAATVLITLVTGMISFMKAQLAELIKERFRAERTGKPLPGLFPAGILLVIISVIIMIRRYGYNSDNTLLTSLGILFVGTFLAMTHAKGGEKLIDRIAPGYTNRHILELSMVKRHQKSRRRISFIAAWMIVFSVFFAGTMAVSYPSFTERAINYSPYDMVYSEIFGMNQAEDKDINKQLEENGVSVKSVKQVEYIRDRAFNLLPVSEVNSRFGCGYEVRRGEFLTIFQEDLKDGYEHNLASPKKAVYDCGGKELVLKMAGSDVRILLNRNPTLADWTLVLNDADYSKIAAEAKGVWVGQMKLYTFDDWRTSRKGVDAVQNYLLTKNKLLPSEQRRYYRATDKLDTYVTAKHSAEFFIFLMLFIIILFGFAADIIVHFKIRAEAEEELRILSGLYRIGVTPEELQKLLQHKNLYYFIPQAVIGSLIGVFYNYMVYVVFDNGWQAAGYSLLAGAVILTLQFLIADKYSVREFLGFTI